MSTELSHIYYHFLAEIFEKSQTCTDSDSITIVLNPPHNTENKCEWNEGSSQNNAGENNTPNPS